MSKGNGLYEQLSEEDIKNIYEYYYQHSMFHNPEQAIKDLEEIKDIIIKLAEDYKTKPE